MRALLALPLALLGASAHAQEPEWERIFDGETLEGWTPKITGLAAGEYPLGMFIVEDGAIRVSYANHPRFEGGFGHQAGVGPEPRLAFGDRPCDDPLEELAEQARMLRGPRSQ